MGTPHSTFSRYIRFMEAPLAVILLGFFIFFGIQNQEVSAYSVHQGDALLNIQTVRGQEIDITIVWAPSIKGLWATGGLTLGIDGQHTAIEIVPPQDPAWGMNIDTSDLSQIVQVINIHATFTIPNYTGPVTETLTGTIKGQITYPNLTGSSTVGGLAFDDVTDDVSLPMRLHLIPSSEVLLPQIASYLSALLLILLLGAGALLRRRQMTIEAAPGATRAESLLILLGGITALVAPVGGSLSGYGSTRFYFLTAGILLVATGYFVSLATLHKFRVLHSRLPELPPGLVSWQSFATTHHISESIAHFAVERGDSPPL